MLNLQDIHQSIWVFIADMGTTFEINSVGNKKDLN